MPRFDQKRWRPAHDSTPALWRVNHRCVVLGIAESGPRRGCPCGCGEYPTGLRAVFRMGHDARLRGKLIRAHLTGTGVIEVYGEEEPNLPIPAMEIARRHAVAGKPFTWEHYLLEAEERRETKNREVLQRALGSTRVISVGRWEYTGQVAAVYRIDGTDLLEIEYVTKGGEIRKKKIPPEETRVVSGIND